MGVNPSVNRLDVAHAAFARPYAPHWFDYLVRWVDRLPGPYCLFYLGLGLILFFIETLIQWRDGIYPVGTLNLFHLVWCFLTPFTLALGHYLYHTAVTALEDFQPVMDASEEEIHLLQYQLTHIPRLRGLLANAVASLFTLILLLNTPLPFLLQMLNVSDSSLSLAFNYLIWLTIGCVGFGGWYALLRQLVLTNRIYTRYTRINLYKLIPLYGFARFGAATAVGLLLLISAYYVAAPAELRAAPVLLTAVFIGIPLALVAFFSPLLGIHRLLVKEKERLLARNAELMEVAIAELHHQIQTKEIAGIDALHKAIESLEREQKILQRKSTWPWSPETLRGVLAAVFLPVIVWAIQWVLQRILEQ